MNGEPAPALLYQSAIDADRNGDLGRARTLLRQAAAAGHGAAALPLAGCLVDGRGGAVEAAEAMRALTPLESGAPIARRMLTAAVMLGDGWPAALARRIAHAQSGDREAGFEIGLLLLDRGSDAAGPWPGGKADAGSGSRRIGAGARGAVRFSCCQPAGAARAPAARSRGRASSGRDAGRRHRRPARSAGGRRGA
ncbi:MAG: hypothetical protein KIS81_09815 [Maricaulaceae bacterium]|nr:hypothetical protein [Maricaulaceae bacterium]